MGFLRTFTSGFERTLYLAVLLLCRDAAPPSPTLEDRARDVVELFESGQLRALYEHELARTSWRRRTFAQFHSAVSFATELGHVVDFVPLEVGELDGQFKVVAEHGEWSLDIDMTEDGTLTRLRLLEIAPILRTPELALPVRGSWQVMWGGEDDALNRRPNDRSRQRAVELEIVDEQGRPHRGEGLELDDYYAYGQPIYAMAGGEVVMVVDGVPDNPLGRGGVYWLGNTIVVRHVDGLHAVYATLKPGSATVKPGDVVVAGQRLGTCGNSGDGQRPRAYVHVQDGPTIGQAWGRLPVFADQRVLSKGDDIP